VLAPQIVKAETDGFIRQIAPSISRSWVASSSIVQSAGVVKSDTVQALG
jgi:hypothetical protein